MRTFRYILSLLAATLVLLAQPAMAQAPETSTKAQPSDPVFPYLLTIQQPAEGATLDVMIMNAAGTYTVVSSGQTVYNGTKVDLFFAPQEGYRLTEGSITYNGNATTAETLAHDHLRSGRRHPPAGQPHPIYHSIGRSHPPYADARQYLPLLRGLERRRREYGSDRGERLHRRSLPHRPMERERAGRSGRTADRDPDHHHHHDRR